MATDGPKLGWITDPKQVFFYVERRVSPPLEELVRTEGFLDALTVVNAVKRIAGNVVRGGQEAIASAVGLPTGSQVERLIRALEDARR
jgi:hypothetical protein